MAGSSDDWEYRLDPSHSPAWIDWRRRGVAFPPGHEAEWEHGAYRLAENGDRLDLFDEPPGGPQFGVETSEGAFYGSVTSLEPGGIVRTIVSGGGCGGD